MYRFNLCRLVIIVFVHLFQIKFDSDSERARILIDLMTYSFNCLKDKVRLKAEKHQWRVDDEAHSIYEAIEKKRVRQLRSGSQMGHGRRH